MKPAGEYFGATASAKVGIAFWNEVFSVHVEAQVKYEDGRIGSISADLKIRDATTFPAAAAKRAA